MGTARGGVATAAKRRPGRRRGRRRKHAGWPAWARPALETGALGAVGVLLVLAVLGRLAGWLAGAGLLAFGTVVLAVGLGVAVLGWSWLALRRRLDPTTPRPAAIASVLAVAAVVVVSRPAFRADLSALRTLLGGREAAERLALAHQVYANYRRADLAGLTKVLERARVYEPTVREAAEAFDVDAEVLMGIGAAESAFYPRDSADGGHGLFQITQPPEEAVADVRRRLGVEKLDALNQRHNAFVAAGTLARYLQQMRGDPFLALLAYNIGPKNGGLRAIMEQYGARDFVAIQPYLQTLPRDYPVRVLTAALAYRLWHTEGHLPRYEEGDNARRIQSVGIPGLSAGTF